MVPMEAISITSILSLITETVTAGGTWLASAATAVTGSPLAMTMFTISLVGIGFGLFKRLMRIF